MPARDALHTNRDLYLVIAELCGRAADQPRSLEDYLTALWQLAAAHRARAALTLSELAGLLDAALRADAPAFDPAWSQRHSSAGDRSGGHAGWERVILDQIVDLHEMAAAGTLANEHRYFGIDAPRGRRWYNFDPATYLECAVAGTFGGWQPGDSTDRKLVPGPVAVLDESGQLTSVDPAEIDHPIVDLGPISWEVFADFLVSGQCYE